MDAQVLDEDLASLVGNPIAELLDLDLDSSDFPNARVLREALTGGRNRAAPQAESRTLMSTPSADGMVTELHLQALGDASVHGLGLIRFVGSSLLRRREMKYCTTLLS